MNYYNEWDKKKAASLEQLILDGLIPLGYVDTRSIADVQPRDLDGFTPHHFFAGIGGWPLAIDLAGWPRDRPAWSASLPCQPWSCAGKQQGPTDDRNLWPHFFRLWRQRKPTTCFGEQSPNAISKGWLDAVANDFESEGHAFASAVLRACSINAPHQRARLFWVASDSNGAGGSGLVKGANTCQPGQWNWRGKEDLQSLYNNPTIGCDLWPQPILCRMDDGISSRVAKIHAFGDAIVPQVAAEFIGAYMDIMRNNNERTTA